MALSAANKADIRYFLGWPARWFQVDSRLEQAFLALDAMTDGGATETLVLAAVTSCKDIDAKLLASHGRIIARTVEDVALNPAEIDTLRREGRRFVNRIARTLGVPVVSDVFGGSSAGLTANYVMT